MRVTSVIKTNERRLISKPYVWSTTCGRGTLDANCVPNKLLLAFLLFVSYVGVDFLKNVGLIRSSTVCCKRWYQMSWCVNTHRKDGYRRGCRTITSSACSASTSVRHGSWFQQRISWRFFSSRTTSFSHMNTIERTWRHAMAFLNPYNRMGDWPTTCLRRGADPTWTISISSSASVQPWTGVPNLPALAVISLHNSPSPRPRDYVAT